MQKEYFQDTFPDIFTYCFGCGRNNKHGLQIKSYWEGDEAICIWKPKKHHRGTWGLLCGGVITTVLDCHCVCTAIASVYKEEGRKMGSKPMTLFAAGTIKVKFVKPTSLNRDLTFRARIEKTEGRKRTVSCSVSDGKDINIFGEVLCIEIREKFNNI